MFRCIVLCFDNTVSCSDDVVLCFDNTVLCSDDVVLCFDNTVMFRYLFDVFADMGHRSFKYHLVLLIR